MNFTVDVIAGDGIGQEVTPAAIQCVDKLAAQHSFSIDWRHRDWGSDYYREHGTMMPVDGIEQMSSADAVFLGAVGEPSIPDDVTLWGLLIPIRRQFQQYVNLRPARVLPGVEAPVKSTDLDVLIVRENTEGEYSEVGGRFNRGFPNEMAIQEAIFTRPGIERVATYAAKLAKERGTTLVSATKSNGIIHSMPFWDEVVAEVGAREGVEIDKELIDALAARFVLKPQSLDVVVASNLYGDILSDLAAALCGSIGIAPSANLNPEREYPSLFEPVHGSAPDIAGQNIANPTAAIWAAAMMLDHFDLAAPAQQLIDSFSAVLASGTKTQDLGGTATTTEFTAAVLEQLG